MDIRKLQRAIVDGLEDVKAQNIVVFNTEHLSALFERVIIASGTSNRQTRSLASSVRERVKEAGGPPPRLEGESNGEWIIVDCGAAVVHVMQPTIREYYHLEELWGDKPVKMKIGSGVVRLVKAAGFDDDDAVDDRTRAGGKIADIDDGVAAKSPARRAALRGPQKGGRGLGDAETVPAKRAATKSVGLKATGAKSPRPKAGIPGTVVGKNAAKKSASAKTARPPATAGKTAAGKTPTRRSVAGPTVRRSKTNSTTMTIDATTRRDAANLASKGSSRSGITRTTGVKSTTGGAGAAAKRPAAKRPAAKTATGATRKVASKG